MNLDDIDRRILTPCNATGRMSNSDLSGKGTPVGLGLSQARAAAGIRRLHPRLCRPAEIHRKMGVPTTVFVEITLQGQADEVLGRPLKKRSRVDSDCAGLSSDGRRRRIIC